MKTRWYKDAVIYQIYPRSFCDSNGDGVGDIKGIISKLDHLKDLGIDAVWLSPCYMSPNDDNGYDISNYRDILPEFGTLDDWKIMIAEMHKRNIKLVMDLVVNHSSDEHFWFKESRKSKDNPYRDYYIWKEGKGKNKKKPPNNWSSKFVGSAWEYDENTQEFYLHLFSKKQPDLNWDNPKVRQEVVDICNFWFELGVDGLRCDVISYISKPEDMRNSKMLGFVRGDDVIAVAENWKKYIREINEKSWANYDSLIVGECAGVGFNKMVEITKEDDMLLDTSFTFDHVAFSPFKCNFKKMKKVFLKFQNIDKKCWTSSYVENHDQFRAITRFIENPKFNIEGGKTIANMIFFHRGTPYIHQGQEIGMTNCPFEIDEYKDILSINIFKAVKKYAPFIKGLAHKILLRQARDHGRTPMQWNMQKNAGFSVAQPWCKINPNYKDGVNVESEEKENNSILNYYKKLLPIRKSVNYILANGQYTDYCINNNKVYIYSQCLAGEMIFVICSFTDKEYKFKLPIGLSFKECELLIANYPTDNVLKDRVLRPYESAVYKLKL